MTPKFNALVQRLRTKIEMSQTPVPGFIIGLSGTDSIVALWALHHANFGIWQDSGRYIPIHGVHYVNGARRKPGMFEAIAIPWLTDHLPDMTFEVVEPLGGNHDPQRWADLHLRALNKIEFPGVTPREQGENYWTVGTMNATEHALGKYSILSAAVSIQPIRSLWKTDIMTVCERLKVPWQIIAAARLPDCLCGREELAAENIELLDQIIRNDFDPGAHDPVLLKRLIDYVRETKRENGWRDRAPYIV